MNKVISILLTLALLFSLTPAALAESIQIADPPEAEEGFWTGVGKFLDNVGGELSDAMSEAGDALSQGWQVAREGLSELAGAAGEWFASSTETLREYADEFGVWAGEQFGGLWQNVKDTASGLWQRFLEGLAKVIARIVDLFIDEEDIQEVLDELSPVVDLYTQEYAHAYAQQAALTAMKNHIALAPEEETALLSLNAYKAAMDENWQARLEQVEANVAVLNNWLENAGQDQKAFETTVTEAAETSTMRRFYGAMVDVTMRYAGENDVSLPEDVVECLQDMSDYASGMRALEGNRQQEITETLNGWLRENAIDEQAYIDSLFAALVGG